MHLKTNYLLIDYENVQPKSLSLLDGHAFKVLVFVGASQSKVSFEIVSKIHTLGNNAEYVQISANGRNALDFHIAFTIGELSKSDENASFYIVSKDTGFDPLIEYLRKKGIPALRSGDIRDIPILNAHNLKAVPEKLETIIRNLSSRSAGKPRKVKTLANTINALFQKSMKEAELKTLIQALEKHGHISIEGEKVTYHL